MDGKKKSGAVMEYIGMLSAVVLGIFLALNWLSSAIGIMPLVSLSPGDALVALLAMSILLYFSGHLLHDHAHKQQRTDEKSPTDTAR